MNKAGEFLTNLWKFHSTFFYSQNLGRPLLGGGGRLGGGREPPFKAIKKIVPKVIVSFSSPEAAILLVSTKDRDLWPEPIFLSMCKILTLDFQPIRFARFDNESVIDGPLVLAPARSWSLVLTKTIAASGDENVKPDPLDPKQRRIMSRMRTFLF